MATARRPSAHDHSSTKPGCSSRLPRRNRCSISPRSRSRSPLGRVARAPATGGMLGREAPSPLRSPALEHIATSLGRHALAEAVCLLPTAPIRLIRAFHADLLGGDVRSLAIIPPAAPKSRVARPPPTVPTNPPSGSAFAGPSGPPGIAPGSLPCYGGPPLTCPGRPRPPGGAREVASTRPGTVAGAVTRCTSSLSPSWLSTAVDNSVRNS